MKPLVQVSLACVALLTLGARPGSGPQGLLSAQPDKNLSPPDVIRLQLAALAHNRVFGRDRGIEVTFRFASPANKALTGPLARFTTMIKGGYPALLDHHRSTLGELELGAVEAKQLVMLQARDGSVHVYLWVLGLQESGPHRGCWMTDAVVELEAPPPAPEKPASAPSVI